MSDGRSVSLYDLSVTELENLVTSWQEPSYRAKQVYQHLYKHFTADPEAMTDLPATLRCRLSSEIKGRTLTLVSVRTGDAGWTRKVLFNTERGKPVETVLMIYPKRATVCVSTQSGCPIRCAFCATGQLGLLDQLSAGQMIEQVLWAARELRMLLPHRSITNVVYMGMGEPFLNYEAWWNSVNRLNDPQGFGLGARSITVSTAGVVPGILKLSTEPLQVNLAISLHAANDTLRSKLVPLNRKYPLADLQRAVREYVNRTRRRVTFEYVLIQGVNDETHHARELVDWCHGLRDNGRALLCHVNLIPWNPVPNLPLRPAQKTRVLNFQRVLENARIPCTVRVQRGVDIGAACGQLAGERSSDDVKRADRTPR